MPSEQHLSSRKLVEEEDEAEEAKDEDLELQKRNLHLLQKN